MGLRRDEQLRQRAKARRIGAGGFAAAAALPWILFHRVITEIASEFRLDLEYLVTGWTAWALLLLGLLFFVPVALSIGRDPDSRLFFPARNAYAGWGVSLYLLGFALATQVSQITRGVES